MNEEAVERLAFWLYKRGRALSIRAILESWTWLPAAAKKQWFDEAREALTYAEGK